MRRDVDAVARRARRVEADRGGDAARPVPNSSHPRPQGVRKGRIGPIPAGIEEFGKCGGREAEEGGGGRRRQGTGRKAARAAVSAAAIVASETAGVPSPSCGP